MPSNSKSRVLDLTSLDREVVDPGYEREPFVIRIGESEDDAIEVSFTDPKELPWDVVITMDESPRRFFSVAIADLEQKKYILRLDGDRAILPLWKLQYVMEQYRAHYGIDQAGNDVASRR